MAVPALTANSPVVGSIAWAAFSIRYNGVTYSIPASTTTNKYVWWRYNNGSPLLQSGLKLPDGRSLYVSEPAHETPLQIRETGQGTGEFIVPGMDVQGFTVGQQIQVNVRLALSHNQAGVVNGGTARLRDGGPTGTILASQTFTDTADSTGGNAQTWAAKFLVTPTTNRLTVTFQSTGDPDVYTTARDFSMGTPELGDDDLLLFLNKSGTPLNAQTASVIDGGLVVSGSILADAIAANSITAKHMYAHSITANELAAGAVTAETIDANSVAAAIVKAGVIQAQLVMTGTIQVGSGYWNTTEGLVIPQNDDGVIRFPVDGSAATIYAHLIARSLNVQDDFTISGYGEVKGEMNLANGITKPTAAPGVAATWPSLVATGMGDGSTDNGEVYAGWTNHHSNADWAVSSISYFGGGLRVVNKRDGNIAVYPDPSTDKGWTANFYGHGGVVYAGGSYYVLGTDNDRDADFYIYRLDTSFNKIGELRIGTLNAFGNYTPRLGPADATSSAPAMFWTPASGALMMRTYNLALTTQTDRTLVSDAGRRNLGGIAWSDYGTGTGAQRMRVWSRNGPTWTFTTTFSRTTTEDMPRAGGANIAGILFDATTKKYISYDNYGRLYYYSAFTATTTFGAAYTWYDGDGTIRETEPSPERVLTLSAGQWPIVTLPPAPDEKITDPTRVDKANRIGIYVRTGSNALRLQKYTKVPVVSGSTVDAERTWSSDVITTTGQTAPTVNGFAGATVQPGRITSGAKRVDGRPKTELSGNGEARLDGLIPPGFMMATTGHAVDRPGWLVANGRSLAVVDYPDLAAEYDLGNGTYRWGGTVAGGTFNLPNSNGRVPIAAGTPSGGVNKPHGGYGGSDTVTMPDHTHPVPNHQHNVGNITLSKVSRGAGSATPTVVSDLSGTTGNQSASFDTGAVNGTNPPISSVSAYFGVTYMIKT